ncbi:DUF2510 domain-containing protein [Streptomyces sp. WMMB 322]|uniref:DUF2510 domain-containing protein n=1 Tax=Streptomyces sp. WMMB 322 TaxID=1286821 RepID=UPI0008239DC8|nr:DUF2510 domain-containing protein [Streptomyces sp. WMMB 322]SCK54291.1 Protein of unknown function [Streptomyces sp. WMMB 322]
MTTPPGWYPDPDPAQRDNSPSAERWWDGACWTGQTRTRAAVRGPLVAGVVGAAVLAAALVVSVVLAFGTAPGSGLARDEAGAGDSDSPGPPDDDGGPPGADPEAPDSPDGDVPATGVDLPVLKGWDHDPFGPMVTTGEYKCPGSKEESCLRGSSVIIVAPGGTAGAEETAKSDIGRFAELAYSKSTYGGITSHEAIASEKTSVAGQDAYRVRWKIVNRTKPDAYVESVAFRHPDGSGEMLLLRTGFDIAKSAPPLSDMDKLAEGVTEGDPGEDGRGKDV